ncbi:MAG: ABC transporter substrate-binding protein [Candidatus Devosia phytovorans]|uniref:ABC transporter substrate-binding protein n=1 Tax=Candidatus Devosia phytovorans TaxID=3121372 RepID=A0AAJ6AZR9_9HYPH|nr:ABC transporter substrate-binding protein [Devosia sp.]WEK03399.1 MAG: ABC transporter substrate-binding protein [Devosia sp.]
MALSRRRFLINAGAASAAAGIGMHMPAAFAQEEVLTIALAARAPTGVNPQQTGLTGGDNWAIYQIFNTLARNPDGKFGVRPEDFEPSLAESWESSADAKTWTYKLRQGVQFHKGYGEMTSEDVAFTIGRHLDPDLVTGGKVNFNNIESVEAPDTYTVVFTLKRPDPLFNGSVISTLPASILSKKAFEEKGEGFNLDPVGTGSYQVESVNETTGITLVAFPEHFGEQPATPKLIVSFIADTTARTLAFASGQVDMIEGVRSPGWIPSMQQRLAETIFDATVPGSFNMLHLNLTREPLQDIRVRQAIRYAIDNDGLAAAYGPLAKPMVGIIASEFEGSVTKDELPPELQYNYDPEKAKALLAEAGFPNGVDISCYTSQREDYAAIMLMIQEQLRAVGINLALDIIDHTAFHAENRQDKNAMPLNSSSYGPVPLNVFLQQVSAGAEVKADGTGQGNFNHYGVAMPGIDDLLATAQDEPDFDERTAIVKEIEKKLLTDLPVLGIITLSYVIARNPRIDLGFPVEGGYAYWPLSKAKRTA